ncbi:uncharacterized protein LOC133783698 isoform X2 [Humulus lupulus]|uniref:uncharacterized protein LOC133783698 isoform X2 n=1 Tax=Humulus lupulus TaxID=3486 RepID=UPI002B408160|nr:uncharacterized protein LOC133783698 isoform X2 [Humulus lupulus]
MEHGSSECKRRANWRGEIQKNIDHYRQLQAEGKWAPDGPDDVLMRALGTPEPRGRVRAGGHGVSHSVYWNTPTPTSTKNKSKASSSNDDIRKEFEERFRKQEEEHRQQTQRLEEHLQQQDELLRKLLAQQSGSGSNVGVLPAPSSYYVPDPPVPPAQASYYTLDLVVPQAEHHIVALQPLLQEGRACQLAIGSVSNIVASGTLIEREAGNNFQVMITSVLKPTCPLPFAYPDLDMYIVAQAIGTPIAWPKDFVIISEDVTHETPSTSRTKSQRPRAPSTQQP